MDNPLFTRPLLWAAASSTAAIVTGTAGDSGMIVSLGEWVLDEALAQVRKWADIGIPAIRVSEAHFTASASDGINPIRRLISSSANP